MVGKNRRFCGAGFGRFKARSEIGRATAKDSRLRGITRDAVTSMTFNYHETCVANTQNAAIHSCEKPTPVNMKIAHGESYHGTSVERAPLLKCFCLAVCFVHSCSAGQRFLGCDISMLNVSWEW